MNKEINKKRNIYIQEIECFKDEISVWELIDKHIKKSWWAIILLPLVLFLGLGIIALIVYKNYYVASILFSVVIGYSFWGYTYMKGKRNLIIRQKYPYAIEGGEMDFKKAILKIQKKTVIDLIDNRLELNKDNLSFLIKSLTSHKAEYKYSYIVTRILMAFFIVMSVIFINYAVHIQTYRIICDIAGFCGVIFILFFGRFKNKEERGYSRLIKVFEDIYLELYEK